MQILKETESKVVTLDCDFSAEERGILFEYALENIPRDTGKNLLIEWAFVDILTKQLKKDTEQVKRQINKEIKNLKNSKNNSKKGKK